MNPPPLPGEKGRRTGSKDAVSGDPKRETVATSFVFSGSPKMPPPTPVRTFSSLKLKIGGFQWLDDVIFFNIF